MKHKVKVGDAKLKLRAGGTHRSVTIDVIEKIDSDSVAVSYIECVDGEIQIGTDHYSIEHWQRTTEHYQYLFYSTE